MAVAHAPCIFQPSPSCLSNTAWLLCVPLRCADYYTLLRFLRARNYIYDKAVKMWLDTIEWRKEYDVDNILENFVFHEREQFLMAYPQGYHKTDKLVCAQGGSCHRQPCSSWQRLQDSLKGSHCSFGKQLWSYNDLHRAAGFARHGGRTAAGSCMVAAAEPYGLRCATL
jgi:hypothetical protein